MLYLSINFEKSVFQVYRHSLLEVSLLTQTTFKDVFKSSSSNMFSMTQYDEFTDYNSEMLLMFPIKNQSIKVFRINSLISCLMYYLGSTGTGQVNKFNVEEGQMFKKNDLLVNMYCIKIRRTNGS